MQNTARWKMLIGAALHCAILPLHAAPDLEPELAADRPDATESPHPVPPGRWQIEMDFAVYAHDSSIPQDGGARWTSWSWGATNLKYGFAPDFDAQVVIEPYRRETYIAADGAQTVAKGAGDLTLRLKWRIHDGGEHAGSWAFLPYVKLPTANDDLGNGAIEGGIVIPYAQDLSAGWSWGLQVGADWQRHEFSGGRTYGLVPTATLVLGQSLTESLGLFYEVAAAVDLKAETDAWDVTLNTGATYALGALQQLDIGVAIGVTRAAVDVTLLTGYSQRW